MKIAFSTLCISVILLTVIKVKEDYLWGNRN
jgi:hypothetical protein